MNDRALAVILVPPMKGETMQDRELTELISNKIFYTIAFTLRSGTNLLCEYLSSIGLGQPTEYFQWPYPEKMKWLYDDLRIDSADLSRYLRELIKHRSSNGIFGCKITWDQKNVLLYQAERQIGGIQTFADLFPQNIWLYVRRRDKVGQAISLWRAAKSGRWTSLDNAQAECERPDYNYFRILQCFFTLLVEEQLWDGYFKSQAILPAEIWYEDLAEDPGLVINGILRRVAKPDQSRLLEKAAELSLRSRLSEQRDEYSERIREQFLLDLNRIGVAEHWASRAAQNQRWEDFFYKEQWLESKDE
jgi:trehalose 2-sulfotransferase